MKPNQDWFAAALLFVIALGLRLVRLFDLDVWFDEVVLLFQVKMSYSAIWSFCKNENFPPLFPWMLKAWFSLFPGENSLRLFCALVASLTPPAAYFLGKELQDRRLGWLLGSACVLSVALISYAQMIRMYCVLPLLACLSVLGFLRGIKSNRWRFWFFTAAINLIGFYTFLFFLFLICAEFLVVLWLRRRVLKQLLRPFIAHLPTAGIMLLWVGAMLTRYQDVKSSFLGLDLSSEFSKLWVFFGTSKISFGDSYLAVILLNLPFLLGVVGAVFYTWRKPAFTILASLIIIPITMAVVVSFSGSSIFFTRYFLFLLPVYLLLVLTGWLSNPHLKIRLAGLTAVYLSMGFSLGYYFYNYEEVHKKEYVFIMPHEAGQPGNGHAMSQFCDSLRHQVRVDEVIIHCSNPQERIFSFFPAIYYNQRSQREYLYSVSAIPNYFGAQYLHEGDQIRSLQDIQPPPRGVWLVTYDPPKLLLDPTARTTYRSRHIWVEFEDLPAQLIQAGFQPGEMFGIGRLTAIHYRSQIIAASTAN
jgi:hypothetical protein